MTRYEFMIIYALYTHYTRMQGVINEWWGGGISPQSFYIADLQIINVYY